jgi:hypothetical protein
MTEETRERVLPVRDRRGTAATLARLLMEEERACGFPCWVHHPDAGGHCGHEATTMVYGLLFCEEHGVEATAGALAELYQDAGDFLERMHNPYEPLPNAEADRVLQMAWREIDRRRDEHDEAEEAALRRAYPVIPERVCYETAAFDYRFDPENPHGPSDQPTEVYQDARRLLCKQMRLAYGEGADWLVEILEYERERASAQLAFALEDYERKAGTPEERERRREEARKDQPAE